MRIEVAVDANRQRGHGALQAEAELESRFSRFDAERKSEREQLQTRFVRWGLGVAILGMLMA